MATRQSTHLFLIGQDYHLGDLLRSTAVLAEYRRQVRPDRLVVACPDRAISRILEAPGVFSPCLAGYVSWAPA